MRPGWVRDRKRSGLPMHPRQLQLLSTSWSSSLSGLGKVSRGDVRQLKPEQSYRNTKQCAGSAVSQKDPKSTASRVLQIRGSLETNSNYMRIQERNTNAEGQSTMQQKCVQNCNCQFFWNRSSLTLCGKTAKRRKAQLTNRDPFWFQCDPLASHIQSIQGFRWSKKWMKMASTSSASGKDLWRIKQLWATRCHQAPIALQCALRHYALGKTKQTRIKPLSRILTLPSLPKRLPKHIPSSCYLWMHRRLSKQGLETTRECRELRFCSQQHFPCWCIGPLQEQSSVVLHHHLSIVNRWCSHRSSSLNLAPQCKYSWPQLSL